MKIVLLAAASSIHTARWANGLCAAGHTVTVISQHPATQTYNPAVVQYLLPYLGSLGYFVHVRAIQRYLRRINPDIVNAHYASGYGTTGRLAGFHPWVLSVWGSDVYDFPRKSPVHRWLVKKNLRAADQIASTSYCMADKVRELTPECIDIAITPFGVDLAAYSEIPPTIVKQHPKLVIGTVKSLLPVYGVDTLIEAYALLLKSLQLKPGGQTVELELRLVGGGEQAAELQALAQNMGVADSVHFIGKIPHSDVPKELAKFDIYAALSRAESFGVAVIEAGAAGRPVVVSDADGLSEVTVEGETGFVVPKENPQAAALALEKLVMSAELRHRMGGAGRAHVIQYYSWDTCIETLLGVYQGAIHRSCR